MKSFKTYLYVFRLLIWYYLRMKKYYKLKTRSFQGCIILLLLLYDPVNRKLIVFGKSTSFKASVFNYGTSLIHLGRSRNTMVFLHRIKNLLHNLCKILFKILPHEVCSATENNNLICK